MKKRKSLVILVTLLVALLVISSEVLLGCSSPSPTSTPAATQPQSAKPSATAQPISKEIRWGTSSVGSSGYTLSAGMTDLVNRYAGYQASITPSTGAAATVRAISRGERDFGFGSNFDVYNGYMGIADFEKEGKQNVLAVAMTYTTAMTFVGQPGINTINDIKGKIFMYRRKANAIWGIYGDAVLKAYGLGEATVKVKESVETNELLDGLKTGAVDVALVPGSIPNSYVTQLLEAKNFSLVDVDKDKVVAISKDSPFIVPRVIPNGTYKYQTKDINTMGFVNMIFCRTDLPDQMVYDVTKAIYSHLDDFSKVDPLAKQFSLEVATLNLPLPLHPGAKKYFEEIGALKK